MRSLLSIGLVATALYFPLANTAAWADKAGSSDVFRWSGFYAGAYLGHAWGESDIRTDAGVEKFAPPTYFATADIDAIKQRSGDFGNVTLDNRRSAMALAGAVIEISTRARVHCG